MHHDHYTKDPRGNQMKAPTRRNLTEILGRLLGPQPDYPNSDLVSWIALSIPEAAQVSGLSRTTLYEAMKDGSLVARKRGRRTLILLSELAQFLRNLPKA